MQLRLTKDVDVRSLRKMLEGLVSARETVITLSADKCWNFTQTSVQTSSIPAQVLLGNWNYNFFLTIISLILSFFRLTLFLLITHGTVYNFCANTY